MATLSREDLKKLYKEAPRSAAGFSAIDTMSDKIARYLTRQGVREHKQAGAMELERLRETGLGERRGVIETGLGKRQKAGFAFERPEQVARIGETGARTRETVAGAEREEYGLEFEKGLESTLKTLVEQKKTLGELDIDVLRKELAGPEAVPVKKAVAKPTAVAPGVAKPRRRKMRPSMRKFLWEGYPERGLPGLGAPLKGWLDISKLLGKAGRGAYEYAFPRSR